MNITLQIVLLAGVVFYFSIILWLLLTRKLNLKYSLLWLASAAVMLVISIFPGIVEWMAGLLGIEAPINLVLIIEGLFVLLILISITSIVSRHTNQIYRLTQTIALLDCRVRQLEKALADRSPDSPE